jgi:hypothetical protein
MTTMLLTQGANFRKAKATNATDTSFPSKVPTATEPTNDGVHDLLNGVANGSVPNAAVLVPYGTGDADDVFAMRVIGWRRVGFDPLTDLWVPVVLAELTCTMSATTGVAGTPVVATEFFVDTLALVTGNDDISIDIVSPTGDEIAHAVVDLKGFQKVEITFDMTTNDPTGANCLVAFI